VNGTAFLYARGFAAFRYVAVPLSSHRCSMTDSIFSYQPCYIISLLWHAGPNLLFLTSSVLQDGSVPRLVHELIDSVAKLLHSETVCTRSEDSFLSLQTFKIPYALLTSCVGRGQSIFFFCFFVEEKAPFFPLMTLTAFFYLPEFSGAPCSFSACCPPHVDCKREAFQPSPLSPPVTFLVRRCLLPQKGLDL